MAIAMNQSMTSTMAQTMAIIMTLSLLPLTSIMVMPKSELEKVTAEPMLDQKESSNPRKQL